MASFGIFSLFTNVPLDETIEIIIQKLFHKSTHYLGFSHVQLRSLLCFAVKNCHFLFNGCLYEQIDGVAMGSPLGPLFANIFLSYHEKNWLDNCPTSFKPLYFRRYVDDCFIIFRSQEHVQPFLDYLNRKHENINFSCELETNGSLPFLDVSIERSNGFSTSVYRKPTFIGLFTNFDSFIPLSFKRNLVYCLLDRYFKICSSYQVFHLEVLQLKNLLLSNGYPSALFEHCLSGFLDKIFSVPVSSPLDNINKRVIYFCLPFTGTHSLRIRTQLVKLLSSCFPDIDLRIVFKPGRRLSDFFQFKDVIPKLMRSHVVYKYKCQCCGALYFGQTCRHLHTRISEHLGISPLSGKKLTCSSLSAIQAHTRTTCHPISFDDFSIMSYCNTASELLIRESLLIP